MVETSNVVQLHLSVLSFGSKVNASFRPEGTIHTNLRSAQQYRRHASSPTNGAA